METNTPTKTKQKLPSDTSDNCKSQGNAVRKIAIVIAVVAFIFLIYYAWTCYADPLKIENKTTDLEKKNSSDKSDKSNKNDGFDVATEVQKLRVKQEQYHNKQ